MTLFTHAVLSMSRRKHLPDAKISKLRLPNHERTYNKNKNKRKEKRRKKKENLAFVKFRFHRMPQSTFVLTNFFKRENVTINKCLHLHD